MSRRLLRTHAGGCARAMAQLSIAEPAQGLRDRLSEGGPACGAAASAEGPSPA
jgi:hypothetical protein